MTTRHLLAIIGLTFGLLCLSSCGDSSQQTDGDSDDPPSTDGDTDRAESEDNEANSPLPYAEFYEELQEVAFGFPITAGDWEDDLGDASFYGQAFYTRAAGSYGRQDYLDRAIVAGQRNLEVIQEANVNFVYFMENLEEVLMAALGLIEDMAERGDLTNIEDLDDLIDITNDQLEAMGMYLDLSINSWALTVYGPTAITGVVALLNLRYADLLDTEREDERTAFGLEIIEAIDAAAWSDSYYRLHPDKEKLYLYPHLIMMLSNSLAYKLTEQAAYRQRLLDCYAAIQPLKDETKGGYRSPYSAVVMGAQTDDYITLSSQNYLLLAQAMLWEVTNDDTYRDEFVQVAAFIHDYLYVDGRLLHHWMDGNVAKETDLEYFCSGCNLQFLYASWYAEQHLFGSANE